MFDSITSTRFRSLSGRSWRKIDFQTCVSVSQFQKRTRTGSCGCTVLVSTAMSPSDLQKCFRVFPLRQLELVVVTLVHEQLSILGEDDAHALERPRRRAFEIDPGR